jgi:plastocyanin
MKRLIAVLSAVAVVVAGFTAIPAVAATKRVSVADNVFRPKSVSIRRNDLIRFVWTGDNPHNVVTTRRPRGAKRITIGIRRSGTVRKRFTRRGTYRLLCSVHSPSMTMTVRVR